MSVEDNTRPPFPQQLNQASEALRSLPQPDDVAVAHSQRVVDYLVARIEESESRRISFADYMEVALNAPGLGYYSVGNQKFGAAGDFITAPEVSDLFAACIAKQCQQYLSLHRAGAVLEIGAGSGRLALDLLLSLERDNCLPAQFFILEPSVDLQQRQAELLHKLVPHLVERVRWINRLPDGFDGVVVANEVLDAMPTQRMQFNDGHFELGFVSLRDSDTCVKQPGDRLRLQFDQAPAELEALMRQRCLQPVAGYTSELAPAREAWVRSLAASLHRGLLLLIDYGYGRHEYYHAQRNMGTLTCHFRHRVHADPFFYPGLQDITAFVEFTAIAEAADAAALQVSGFATQAQFLLSCGLDGIAQQRMQRDVEQAKDENAQQLAQLRLSQEMKRLIMPSEMGENFKVMALTKNFSSALLGFSQFDMRHKL